MGASLSLNVTLAELMVETHVEARVDFVEFGAGKIDAPLPDGEVFRVAGLELGEFGAATVGHRRVTDDFDRLVADSAALSAAARVCWVDARSSLSAAASWLPDRCAPTPPAGRRRARFIEEMFPAVDDFAELRAPVAEVVVGDDRHPREPRHAREAVADDRRTQVADVHRLGDVRAAEVDDDRVRFFRRGQAQARGVGVERAEGVGEERGFQAEIDEPRARDFRRRAEVAQHRVGA